MTLHLRGRIEDTLFEMSEVIGAFEGEIVKDETSGWTCVGWPDSVAVLGTGKTVKVHATVDGLAVEVTLMPTGKGHHMLPLKQETRKKLKKDIGDQVTVCIVSRR